MRLKAVRTTGGAALLLGLLAAPAQGEVRDISSACPEQWAVSFSDVPESNLHVRSVECVAAWAIARGTSADTYTPAQDVTRAQMATFIARTIVSSGGDLDPNAPDAFDDDDGSAHEISINALAAVGIVSGVSERSYRPGAGVTRAQMATFLVRAFEYRAGELPSGPDAFTDDHGDRHEPAIDKAAEAGFVAGTGAAMYSPSRSVRRDAMASFIARTLDKLVADGHMAGPPQGEPSPSGEDPGGAPPPEEGAKSAQAASAEAAVSSDGTVFAAAISWYDYGSFQCEGVSEPEAYAPRVASSGYVSYIPEYMWFLPDGQRKSEWGQWLYSYQGSSWNHYSNDPFYPPPAYTGQLAVRNWVYDHDTGEWWNSWSTTLRDINGHGGGQYYCSWNAWGQGPGI